MDFSPVTDLIADAGVAGASVGIAVLLCVAIIKCFGLIRAALGEEWVHEDPEGFSLDDDWVVEQRVEEAAKEDSERGLF